MANDYLTVAEFQARTLAPNVDSMASDVVTAYITAASRLVDNLTNRDAGAFATDGNAAEVRYFDGQKQRSSEAWIDDCVSISGLAVSYDWGDTYETWTVNTDYWQSDGETYGKTPIRLLVVNPNGNQGDFPIGPRALKVTATWGYSTTPPAPVKEAVSMLVQQMVHHADGTGEADRNFITPEGFIVPAVDIPPKVKALVSYYARLV